MAALCVGVYFGSSYILNIKNTKEQIAANNVDKISNYLDSKKYKDLTATQKIELLKLLKNFQKMLVQKLYLVVKCIWLMICNP